jgi:hypothetical protein
VDVLFPTPHSAIQDHLGRQMHVVYADRIARQRTARAHDALVMKVLHNVAEQQKAAIYDSMARAETTGSAPAVVTGTHSPADVGLPAPEVDVDRGGPRAPALGPERIRTIRVGAGRAVILGVLAGLVVAAAGWAAAPWMQDGVLVVTSAPPGAAVVLDGRPVPGATPLVVEGVRLSEPHRVEAELAGHRSAAAGTRAEPGRLVQRVHLALPSALGSITVESRPPGAEVRVDGKPVGKAPVMVDGIRVDERHRIDLSLPGHELDQVVVLPEKDGAKVVRQLVPRPGGRG